MLQNRRCSCDARRLTYAVVPASSLSVELFAPLLSPSDINSSWAELCQATLSAFAVKWLHNDISSQITADWNSVVPREQEQILLQKPFSTPDTQTGQSCPIQHVLAVPTAASIIWK